MEKKKIEIKKTLVESKKERKPYYHIEIECDANDGDYLKDSFELVGEEINDLFLLMLSYFSMYDAPKKWAAIDNPYEFGGHHIEDNDRFNREDEEDNWLFEFATEGDLLLYAGMCDDYCHSISDIQVTYFDENGNKYNCELPNLEELFESEKEFIEYVRALDDED